MTPYDVINIAASRIPLDTNFTRENWLAWVYLMRVSRHF